jgi:hypothetical protein
LKIKIPHVKQSTLGVSNSKRITSEIYTRSSGKHLVQGTRFFLQTNIHIDRGPVMCFYYTRAFHPSIATKEEYF